MRPSLRTSIRYLQLSLGLCFFFYFVLLVTNNCLDYQANFSYIKHVMSMDTTFEASKMRYRAIHSSFLHNFVYLSLIVWEVTITVALGAGCFRLIKNLHSSSLVFQQSKGLLITALNLSVVLWFYAFIIVGSEWFMMWQSPTWNGRPVAFDTLLVNLLTIGLLLYHDSDQTPSSTYL